MSTPSRYMSSKATRAYCGSWGWLVSDEHQSALGCLHDGKVDNLSTAVVEETAEVRINLGQFRMSVGVSVHVQ